MFVLSHLISISNYIFVPEKYDIYAIINSLPICVMFNNILSTIIRPKMEIFKNALE